MEDIGVHHVIMGDKEKLMILNFTKLPELFNSLVKSAEEDFRTPEMQCLSILKQRFNG